ncbi:MAG: TetR/AcrR family transcriptional regulator, partial [Fermentimonas sp.]|nr:TetR/AcrR family transcriptional regulator [Fermentimonas sp.]
SEKSRVFSGYLYRYYSSKEELIQDIIESKMEVIRNTIILRDKSFNTVFEYLYNMINGLFELVNSDPILGKFIAILALDTNIPKWAEEKKDIETENVTNATLRLGIETGEINEKRTVDDIELIFFTLPVRYILLELTKNENKKFGKEEAIKITTMCLNAIR